MTFGKLFPVLARELATALDNDGHRELGDCVPALSVVRRCCHDVACASFFTLDVTEEDIANRGKRIIAAPVPGLLCLFTIDDSIAFVELLNRPDVRVVLDDTWPAAEH